MVALGDPTPIEVLSARWLSDPRLLSGAAFSRLGLGDRTGAYNLAAAAYRLQRMNSRSTYVLGQVLKASPGHEARAVQFLTKASQMGMGS